MHWNIDMTDDLCIVVRATFKLFPLYLICVSWDDDQQGRSMVCNPVHLQLWPWGKLHSRANVSKRWENPRKSCQSKNPPGSACSSCPRGSSCSRQYPGLCTWPNWKYTSFLLSRLGLACIWSQTRSLPRLSAGFCALEIQYDLTKWWWVTPGGAVGHSFGGTARLSDHLGNRNKLSCPRHHHHLHHSDHYSRFTKSNICRVVFVFFYQTWTDSECPRLVKFGLSENLQWKSGK